MYFSDTELFFPMRVAPNLRNLRTPSWRDLVDRACASSETSLDGLAFCLLLIRLSDCLGCHTSSFRALRGCTRCAVHSVRSFRGADDELLNQFGLAREEIRSYCEAQGLSEATR
jgi:hypothetical protein